HLHRRLVLSRSRDATADLCGRHFGITCAIMMHAGLKPPFLTDLVLQFLDQLGYIRIGPRQHFTGERAPRQASLITLRYSYNCAANAIESDHDHNPPTLSE